MNKKKYIGFCRVSTKAQAEEGVSLDAQAEAIRQYVTQQNGILERLWQVAETGYKPEDRHKFREMVDYAKTKGKDLTAVLFYSTDRSCRNDEDRMTIAALHLKHKIPIVFVTEPYVTVDSAVGKLIFNTTGAFHEFQSAQTSEKVKASKLHCIANEGRFQHKAPYGYDNIRKEKRATICVHPRNGEIVKRLFEEFSTGRYTLDSFKAWLKGEGITYTENTPDFPRSKLHTILTDRQYLGLVVHKGVEYSGIHESLVSKARFEKVQCILGRRRHERREITYSGGLFTCAECGGLIVGEEKHKKLAGGGERVYHYYRCSRYNQIEGHSKARVTEAELEQKIVALLETLRWDSGEARKAFLKILRSNILDSGRSKRQRLAVLQRQYQEAEARKANALTKFVDSQLGKEDFEAVKHGCTMRCQEIRREMALLELENDDAADLAADDV